MPQLPHDLDHLLHHKDFAALTGAERDAVLAEISREDYEALRATVNQATRCLRDTPTGIRPRAETEQNLRDRMRRFRLAQSTLGAGVLQALIRPIPAYQAVAAGVLLVFGLHFLGRPHLNPGSSPQATIMIADSTDSVKTRKAGINTGEDTVFSRFLIDSM
jgi:hypothetical protein